ncbi:MAG: AI-2E family transporter [Armatimonadetes bacterium]|nr:AI-2E family transporter [Armatimonadota bacterium]
MNQDRGGETESHWTPRQIAVATAIVAGVTWLVFRGSSVAAYILGRLADVFGTLVVAIAVAYIVWPAVVLFEQPLAFLPRRTRRAASALMVVLGFVGGVVLLVVLTATPLLNESKRLADLAQEWAAALPQEIEALSEKYGYLIPDESIAALREKAFQLAGEIVAFQAALVKGLLLRGWLIVEGLIVPVLAFYFVSDAALLAEGFLASLPAPRRARARAMGEEMNALMHGYVRAAVILCILMGFATGLTLYLAGVRLYITLGFLAGLGFGVPIIGPIVAAVPIGIITLAQVGWRTTLVVLLIYAGLNALENKILRPKVLGGSVRLHPVTVIVALLVGAEFLGVIGVFIAVPVAAVLRVFYTYLRQRVGIEEAPADAPT